MTIRVSAHEIQQYVGIGSGGLDGAPASPALFYRGLDEFKGDGDHAVLFLVLGRIELFVES